MPRYFQGDVFLFPTTTTQGTRVPHEGAFVVAVGESHHQHVIRGQRQEAFDVFRDEDITTILMRERCEFLHETASGAPGEHATLSIEPGVYEVAHERELDIFANLTRRVSD